MRGSQVRILYGPPSALGNYFHLASLLAVEHLICNEGVAGSNPVRSTSMNEVSKLKETINTYKDSAEALARKFDSMGVREGDVREVFELLPQNPDVLEIGCGNGRDASEILKHTSSYLGIDVSPQLIALAREKNPQGTFEIADVEQYAFPHNLDAIFAFASLIHLPKESFQRVLDACREALKPGGVLRLSMKRADIYTETTKEDEFGTRTYYLYSEKDIEEAAKGYRILKNGTQIVGKQVWLEVLLQKI